jgi:DNA-binding CsgD family transcriptional regulator
MKLLERDKFLSELNDLFIKAKNENGCVVAISGEAGIGKTSLVEHFTNHIEDKASVLWGTCDDLCTPRPLAPLYDIASQLNSKIVDQLDSGNPRPSIFSNFLKEIQNNEPNIIVIEDMHWADESTLDLLQFLGRRINKSKSLLIITYRDDEIKSDHPLRLALSNIPSNNLKRIKLTQLSENAVKLLAKNYGRDYGNLYSITGGNPLFVTEVLSNEELETPATIKELVTSKLNRLSSEARSSTEMISVIPGKVEKWLIEKLVREFNLIDESIELGILKVEGESVLFRHELTRMAIEESLSESKRINLNSKVLNVLIEQENIDHYLSRIFHHASKAIDVNTIIKYSIPSAAQASMLGAHRQAVKIYNTALQYSDQLFIEQHLKILEGKAYECFLTGQISEAIKTSEIVIEILKKNPDPEREGEMYRRLSRILWYDCHDAKGEDMLDKALEIFEKLQSGRNLAMAYSNKAQTYSIREELGPVLYWGNKALQLAKQIADKEVEAHVLNSIGCTKMLVEDTSGQAALLKSLEISLQNNFYEQAARAYVNLGCAHLQQRNLLEADKIFLQGLEYCNEKDIYVFSLCMAGHHSKVKLHLGRWAEAIDTANSVLNKESLPPGNSVMCICLIGLVRARRNDPGALKYIDNSFKLAFQMGEKEKIVFAVSARAEFLWLQNKLDDFADELYTIFLKVLNSNNPWAIGELAYWVWKSGRIKQMPKLIAKPYLLQIQGNWNEAAQVWKELHCPYEQALALSEGDEESMKKALEIFERLGASATTQLIKQKMRESGIRSIPKGPRQSTKENVSGLTKRQQEVLEQLANGLSNMDIAAKLYISPKTVDHHVSAILSKLNIRSRSEAAAFMLSNEPIKK